MSARQPLAATCTFVLQLADGRYVVDPVGAVSESIDEAHVWLWPLAESNEARQERVAAICKRHPWIRQATAVRSRP